MEPAWLDASFGPLSATLGLLLLGYYLVGEPLVGVWALRRLRRGRPADPGALVAFYRLTLGILWAAAAVVLVVVAVEPGLDPAGIGIAWPVLPPGTSGMLVIGAVVGVVIGMATRAIAARRSSTPAPVPDSVALIQPSTSLERRWAGTVAVTAGVAEELVFRGLFLALGIGLFGLSLVLAAVAVTVVFALAHVYQGVAGVVATAALGAVFAVLALATGSLLLPVLLHIAIDVLALLARPRTARAA